MVFCNKQNVKIYAILTISHNPYFNRWFSAIVDILVYKQTISNVTILILIDGFLQYLQCLMVIYLTLSHNPYFNRWFSAI